MTVSSSTDRATFPGNSIATVFPLPFRFFSDSDIQVSLIDDTTGVVTQQTLGVHYSLAGASLPEQDGSPASVLTMVAAPATGVSLFALRVIPVTQPTDIVNQGRFLPEIHENVFDRLTMLSQQNAGSLDRAMRVQDYDPVPSRLPGAIQRANKLLSFDSSGNPIAVAPAAGSATDLELRLAASGGADLVGYGAGTVKDALDGLNDEIENLGNSYLSIPSAASVTLDLSVADTFGVLLSSNISSLTLVGGVAGKSVSIDVVFSQDATGARTVATPSNVRLPSGVASLASLGASEITLGRFTNNNNSSEWLYQIIAVYSTTILPALTDENFIFSAEGGSTAGWTGSNATFATSAGWLRTTKTGAGASAGSLPLSSPINTKQDFIMYVGARVSFGTNGIGVLNVIGPSSWWPFSLWLNSANASTFTEGAVSIQGYDGTTIRQAQVVGAAASSTVPLNIAIQYDSTFNAVTVWVRQSDGRYKFGCRIVHNFSAVNAIGTAFTDFSNAGSWVEFDYFSLARPNIAVISDSISAGATLFDPNPANGLSNDESTWMRHAVLYPALRNNLVVNKGVGGNTSAQILSRIADATGTGAKVVFLQASNNDEAASISLATRTSNIQSSIDAITAAGASAVLINGLYGTSSAPDNLPTPDFMNYMSSWWDTNRLTLSGVSLAIDTMTPVRIAGDFVDPAKAQADGIHPNISGHTAIGDYIETFN